MTATLQEYRDLFASLPDRAERIQTLIELAKQYKPAERPKPFDERQRVPGCESEVFVWGSQQGGHWTFEFAVENPQGMSAMAMAAVLQSSLDGASADEIRAIPDDVIYEFFGRELSMGKSMGLMGMVQMCKRISQS